MPSEAPQQRLNDIRYHIDLIHIFVEDMDYDAFKEDVRTLYAVTRCLEIISEASRRLSIELKARHPDIPWADMAGVGNVYRHDYENVLDDIVWRTVQTRLHQLQVAVDKELAR